MSQVQATAINHSNTQGFEKKVFNTNEKPKDVRKSNIIATKCKNII